VSLLLRQGDASIQKERTSCEVLPSGCGSSTNLSCFGERIKTLPHLGQILDGLALRRNQFSDRSSELCKAGDGWKPFPVRISGLSEQAGFGQHFESSRRALGPALLLPALKRAKRVRRSPT